MSAMKEGSISSKDASFSLNVSGYLGENNKDISLHNRKTKT